MTKREFICRMIIANEGNRDEDRVSFPISHDDYVDDPNGNLWIFTDTEGKISLHGYKAFDSAIRVSQKPGAYYRKLVKYYREIVNAMDSVENLFYET